MEIKFAIAFKLLPIQNGCILCLPSFFLCIFLQRIYIFLIRYETPYNKLFLFGRVFNLKLSFIMQGRFSFNLRLFGELYEKLWNMNGLRFSFYSVFFYAYLMSVTFTHSFHKVSGKVSFHNIFASILLVRPCYTDFYIKNQTKLEWCRQLVKILFCYIMS